MIIGVDMGASAVKLCALEGERILRTHYEHGRGGDVPAMLERLGLDAAEAEAIALTGLAAKNSGLERLGRPLSYISEPEAIGEGACWLSGRDDIVVASIGTGTAFVRAKAGEYTHLCGTGVGGGTLKGLSVKLLGLEDMSRLNEMAMRGRNGKVDLLIGDFVEGYGILDQEITASNLARMDPTASDEDWAAGISTLVLQVIGTMSLLACEGSGAPEVVVIGAMAASAPSRRNFAQFERVYGKRFIIPEHSACATAIGAARRARCV
jgi:type II pantothenate kinase